LRDLDIRSVPSNRRAQRFADECLTHLTSAPISPVAIFAVRPHTTRIAR
jgi:hypothetical protein